MFLLFAFLLLPVVLFAAPVFVVVDDYTEAVAVPADVNNVTYFGELTGFPHTYIINLERSRTLNLSLAVPHTRKDRALPSVLVVQDVPGGGVSEVDREMAQDTNWTRWRETSTFDRFAVNETLVVDVPAGEFIIEVSSGDNIGPYALVVGERTKFGTGSYMNKLVEVWQIKEWAGKSVLSLMKAPVYLPFTILILFFSYLLYRRYA